VEREGAGWCAGVLIIEAGLGGAGVGERCRVQHKFAAAIYLVDFAWVGGTAYLGECVCAGRSDAAIGAGVAEAVDQQRC
jgi:hypothetical protein